MRRKQIFIFILIFGCFLMPWSMAVPEVTAQGSAWRTYTYADCINDLTVAGDYLWAATCGGVVRWSRTAPQNAQDRNGYLKYTTADGLASNQITAIAVDGTGHVWAGLEGQGVSEFDGQGWTTYTQGDGLIDNWVNAIASDGAGHKWFATPQGLSEFDGQAWRSYTTADGLASNYVTALAFDRNGATWVGTYDGGVSKFDGQTWTTYTPEHGLAYQQVNAITIDEAGQVWFGTSKGVSRFDGQTWTTYTIQDGLMDNTISAIASDGLGSIWVGSLYGQGVSVFDGQTWTTHTVEHGLASNSIAAIASDGAGRIWAGAPLGAGVSMIDGQIVRSEQFVPETQSQIWTLYPTANDLPGKWTHTIFSDSTGQIWLGTNGGVSRFDGQSWTTYTTADGLANNEVTAITADQAGHIWVATWPSGLGVGQVGALSSVSEFDGTTWLTHPIPDYLAQNRINAITIDQAGHKWFGTSFGVSVFDGQNWTTYEPSPEQVTGLLDYDIIAIAIDQADHKWFVAHSPRWQSASVSEFDGQNWTIYTQEDGLAHDLVNGMAIDPAGAKWFATANGVSVFDGQNWMTYTVENGLASNDVRAIAIDAAGHKWFATAKGVSKFDGQTWTTYTVANGLASDDVRAVTIDAAGQPWFITANGVSKLDPTLPSSPVFKSSPPVQTLLVASGQPGRLYAFLAKRARLLISDDFGQTWSPFPGGLPECTRNLNLDYANPDALYASTCQGLYRWSDKDWLLVSSQEMGVVAIPYDQPDTLWAAVPAGPTEVPVIRSDNGGETWNPASRYLGHANGVANLAIASEKPNFLYATVWPQYAGSYLRRGTANGQWEELASPLNNSPIGPGFILDGGSGTLYVTTHKNGGQLWRSFDPTVPDANSIQWELVHDFGPRVQVELLASGWGPNGLALYANLIDPAWGSQPVLHRSLDGGQTWEPLVIT